MPPIPNLRLLCVIAFILNLGISLKAQTIHVDQSKGSDQNPGSAAKPVASLSKAAELAADLSGSEPITIKIAAGVYVLNDKVAINGGRKRNLSSALCIEAEVSPDDPEWEPNSMPVIMSVAGDNSTFHFPHSVGLSVERNNVSVRGIKFNGNPNGSVEYYYPIVRESETQNGLNIDQCYFVGERNSEPIQSGIWANGGGIKIDHDIFYGCRNAAVLLNNIRGLSFTHSIVYGAYESAVWLGKFDAPFEFDHNIVTHCNFFIIRIAGASEELGGRKGSPIEDEPHYHLENSLISENAHYIGYEDENTGDLVPDREAGAKESGIRKSGTVALNEVSTHGLPHEYLNPIPGSRGSDLVAGIFLNPVRYSLPNAAEYVGSYQLNPQLRIEVTNVDGVLSAQATGQGKYLLRPTLVDRFKVVGILAAFSFERNATGKVVTLVVHQPAFDGKAPLVTNPLKGVQ